MKPTGGNTRTCRIGAAACLFAQAVIWAIILSTMPTRVFISYSHDTPEHLDRVWELSERLRADGIDCRIDQHEESPREGWPRWCLDQIEESQFVLVACTATYLRRYRGKEEPD